MSQEVFDAVQAKLSVNRQQSPRNNTVNQYLPRGLVSCGKCRLSAMGRTTSPGYGYYLCRGKSDPLLKALGERCTARFVPAGQLDDLVWADLRRVLLEPDSIRQALERARSGHWLPQELQARQGKIRAAVQVIETQEERLLEAYLAKVLELPEFERKRSELIARKATLQAQLLEVEAMARQRVELAAVTEGIEAFCQSVRAGLEGVNFEGRRQLVELLVDCAVVTDEVVEVRYAVPTFRAGPHEPFSH